MKKFIFLLLFSQSTTLFADELINFDAINSAIANGKNIRIVMDFSKVTPNNNLSTSMVNIIGAYTPNAIQVVGNHIATSLMHFTLNHPKFLNRPIYEFVPYTITQDNSIIFTDQVLDALNYTALTNPVSFTCKINSCAKVYD